VGGHRQLNVGGTGRLPVPPHGGQDEGMYVPRFNALDDDAAIRAMVRGVGSAELVTVGEDGYPSATRLPVVWEGDRLVMHLARANPHWRSVPADGDVAALAVVTGAEAYVSPSWYPTKAEHGRVVPTWNYSAVHVTGRLRRHEDPEWLRRAVTLLTEQHESIRAEPWAVTDAPATYVDKQLRAIVGLELRIERVEGKAKLSQNRSAEDRAGVVTGLRVEGGARESVVAAQMEGGATALGR
jgi:transcriptional regulator